MKKRVTYLTLIMQFAADGARMPDKWEQHEAEVYEEDFETACAAFEGFGHKIHMGIDPDTGEEIHVPPVDVEATAEELMAEATVAIEGLAAALSAMLGITGEETHSHTSG